MYGLDDIREAKGIHMAHINVRSMTNKWEILKMNFMSTNLHIIGVSETWLNSKLPSELYASIRLLGMIENGRKTICHITRKEGCRNVY